MAGALSSGLTESFTPVIGSTIRHAAQAGTNTQMAQAMTETSTKTT